MPRNRDEELIRQLGLRIRHLRTARGWTQQTLAEHAGLEPASVSRMETGKVALSLSTLVRISDALTVSLPEFFSFDRTTPESFTLNDGAEFARWWRTLGNRDREILTALARQMSRRPIS